MNYLINKIASEKITTILSIVVISQLAVLIFLFQSPTFTTPVTNGRDSVLLESKNYSLSKTLYPKGTIENHVSGIKVDLNTISVKNDSTDLLKSQPKSVKTNVDKEKITTIPTPSLLPTYNSTIKGRDADRTLITQLLADRISEYYSLYNKYPNIYLDKSKNELLSKPSNILYFYNVDENRTNSLALTLGDKDDSYLFVRSLKCGDYKSLENEVVFAFDEKVVALCREDGSVDEFAVMQ